MVELVTGRTGTPHVTSGDVQSILQGVFGRDTYILDTGEKMKPEAIGGNEVKISDGDAVGQGVHFRIKPGTYETVSMMNGTQGQKRLDYIVARYSKSLEGIESIELTTVEGKPHPTNPQEPVMPKTDVRAGETKADFPIILVEWDGINIVKVSPACKVMKSMDVAERDSFEELNKYFSPTSAWRINRFFAYREGYTVHINFWISTDSWQPDTEYTCFTTTLPKRLLPYGGASADKNPYSHAVPLDGSNSTGNQTGARECKFSMYTQDGTIKVITPTEPWAQDRGNHFSVAGSYCCKGVE